MAGTYVDRKGREWIELFEKEYLIETDDDDTLCGTATILIKKTEGSTGSYYLIVDKEHQIEARSLGFDLTRAKHFFYETISSLGKLKWL